MPPDPRALDACLAALRRFFDECAREEPRPQRLTFPNPEWRLYDTGLNTFTFKREETVKALQGFRKKFETDAYLATWSLSHIRKIEDAIVDAACGGESDDELKARIIAAFAELDQEAPSAVSLLPISHLYLGDYEHTFGNVTLKTITQERQAEVADLFRSIIASATNDDASKAYFQTQASQLVELLRNRAYAFVQVQGDPERAKENALRDVEPVTDLLQLMAGIFEHRATKLNIGVRGDLLTKQPARFLIGADQSSIHHEQDLQFAHRLTFNAERMDDMRSFGFGALIDALGKADSERSEFEAYLLRSMHWVADAERQEREDNKITGYVTAIDMFFATKGEPLTRDVTEGAAMILGGSLANRKRIRAKMGEFYELRSGVSHAGTAAYSTLDVLELKNIAVNFLAKMCALNGRFQTKDAFRSWMADRRLGGDEVSD